MFTSDTSQSIRRNKREGTDLVSLIPVNTLPKLNIRQAFTCKKRSCKRLSYIQFALCAQSKPCKSFTRFWHMLVMVACVGQES